MRLIRAIAPILVSLSLVGCGGGDGVTQNGVTAPDTAPASGNNGTGSAKISWVAPTRNSNGSSLTNLAGYIIYYGTDSGALTQTIQVANPSALGYVVTGLATGTTWYFSVSSYTTSGEESSHSAVASKTI